MGVETENELYQLRVAIERLTVRVRALEQKFGRAEVPLKKRLKVALNSAKNDLALARDRAREQGDTEVVAEIEDLMAKVG